MRPSTVVSTPNKTHFAPQNQPAADLKSPASPKPAAQAPSASVHAPPAQQVQAHAQQSKNVRVFTSDDETSPSFQFQANTPLKLVLQTLRLKNGGGLKHKGGEEVFVGLVELPAGDYVIFGAAPIRVRVSMGPHHMLIPYLFPTNRVHQLMDEIAVRFQRFNTDFSDKLRIAELRTLEGFLLNKFDRVSDVLADNDGVSAVDFKSWQTEQEKLCKTYWLNFKQLDYEDDWMKWICVGKHEHGKLFISAGKGSNKTLRLELFELDELKEFAKDGKQTVMSLKDGSALLTASFNVVNSEVKSVHVEIKTGNDERGTIKEIPIEIGEGGLKHGEIKTVQYAVDQNQPEYLDRPIPPTKREGPQLPEIPAPEKADLAKATLGALKIEQSSTDPIDADQNWARDGVYRNMLYINLVLTNPSDSPVTISNITTQYKVGNEWKTPEDTYIGWKQGYYNYNWNNDKFFAVAQHDQKKVVVIPSIAVKSGQVDKNRRLHHSLPNPMIIKITFQDDQGITKDMEIEYRNPAYDFYTKESLEAYNKKKYVYYGYCDDHEAEYRQYIAVSKEEDSTGEYLVFYIKPLGSQPYLYQDTFNKIVYKAIKEGKEEIEIENFRKGNTDKDSGDTVATYANALVDLKHKRVYGIKFFIKSHNNYVEETMKVPFLKKAP